MAICLKVLLEHETKAEKESGNVHFRAGHKLSAGAKMKWPKDLDLAVVAKKAL
jgi:hypothetical protein